MTNKNFWFYSIGIKLYHKAPCLCFCAYKSFNPMYLEWYGPSLDLEHTIQVCRGENFHYQFS